MNILILQAFLCRTQNEFDELCSSLQTEITLSGSQPLFEIAKTGYTPWVPQLSQTDQDIQTTSLQEGFLFVISFTI